MQSSKNREYTAADIERYYAGSMPAEEMHALESAALDDPFLADALQGYKLTSTPSADLQKIRERLAAKKEKSKLIPFYHKYQWLKLAAVILILAGGGWVAIRLTMPADNTIALQKQTDNAKLESESWSSPFIADSAQNSIVKADEIVINEPIQNPGKDKAPADIKKNYNNTIPGTNTNKTPVILENQKTEEIFKDLPRITAIDPASNTRNRNIQAEDYSRRALPNLEETNRNQSQYENFLKRRSAEQEEKNVALYEANARKISDTVSNLNIVMKPDNAPPAEVIILSKGRSAVARKPVVIIDTLEPAEGWANFDDYIASNIKAPEELKLKSMTGGEVQLSFDVNKEGEPVNIAVVKSLCEECDAEAIRLLKEGPRWKKKENKKGRITIRF